MVFFVPFWERAVNATAKGKSALWRDKEGLLRLEAWARDGATDEQIAAGIGISRSTLSEWKKRYPDIADALKKGKEVVDIQVENALLRRALGYQVTETTRERVTLPAPAAGQPGEGMVVTKEVTREVLPDTTAQIFWLKNRRPDRWRDKRDLGVEAAPAENPLTGLSTEELRQLILQGERDAAHD